MYSLRPWQRLCTSAFRSRASTSTGKQYGNNTFPDSTLDVSTIPAEIPSRGEAEDSAYFKKLIKNFKVEIKMVSPSLGRGLFAKEHLKSDEVLFDEDPIVSVLKNPEGALHQCGYCLASLEQQAVEVNGVRLTHGQSVALGREFKFDPERVTKHCERCNTAYCSDKCKNLAAERFHALDCKLAAEKRQPNWREFRGEQSFRVWEMTYKLLLGMCNHSDNSTWSTDLEDHIFRFSYYATPPLQSTADCGREYDQLRSLFKRLPLRNEYWLKNEGLDRILSAITNNRFSFSVYPTKLCVSIDNQKNIKFKRAVDTEKERVEGIGLYVLSRYINHVCPGSRSDCVGVASPLPTHRRFVLTSRDIVKGEELCWPYLLDGDQKQRREELKRCYGFDCTCDVCQRRD